jgi:type IV secretory pathway VirB6-like protein
MTEHIRYAKDLHDCLVLFSSRVQNSLDYELWWCGDVNVVQQIPQFASEDRGFISKGLDLIGISVRLFLLSITQTSVVFIIFTFSLIAFLFIIILMVIIVVVVLR